MNVAYEDMKKINVLRYIMKKNVHNKINILKVVYIANKYHLNEYGREVIPERYRAMQYGPVPFDVYDILKQVAGKDSYIERLDFSEFFKSDRRGINFYNNDEPDLSYLSESDKECLNKAINEYGYLSFGELKKKIRKDPAYSRTDRNKEIEFLKIINSLPNSKELIEYLDLENA